MTSWGLSLSNLLDKKDWDKIRHQTYQESSYTCVICEKGDKKLNSHEVWAFDDRKRIQTLVRTECLCRRCHQVKHFGRSKAVYSAKYVEGLISHWCKINGKTREDFTRYELEIKALNKKRAEKVYRVFAGRKELTQ